jgi:archaellum component FlaF (FlaF/FlaG flagellin family)
MKSITFERIVGLTSLFIASCAAFFSIIGIGMLFSGSSVAAMIMASSLEIGKLTATSFLYRYWDKTKTFLKLYLTIAIVVLMFITSLGIFGYLSGAYEQSHVENQLLDDKIKTVEEQKTTVKNKIDSSKTRILNITQIRNNQEFRLNESMTNVVINRNPIQARQIQQQTQEFIEQNERDIEKENVKIQAALDEIQSLNSQINTLKTQSGSKKDVQTFKFIASEFGVTMNSVAKWFIIALISVFDPLAICLLLAYNTTLISTTNKEEHVEAIQHTAENEDVKLNNPIVVIPDPETETIQEQKPESVDNNKKTKYYPYK